MMRGKPSNNSFGPFLKTLGTNPGQDNAPAMGNGAFPVLILQTLAEGGPLSVAELLKRSRMRVLDLSSALSAMQELQLVEMTRQGDDQDEIVRLSPTGQRLVVQPR